VLVAEPITPYFVLLEQPKPCKKGREDQTLKRLQPSDPAVYQTVFVPDDLTGKFKSHLWTELFDDRWAA